MRSVVHHVMCSLSDPDQDQEMTAGIAGDHRGIGTPVTVVTVIPAIVVTEVVSNSQH